MLQKIKGIHHNDEQGKPGGGTTLGLGIKIDWQNSPLGTGTERKEPNGAFVEGVIAAAINRLEYYQASKFKCRENALAITKLEEALHWCMHRTQIRTEKGIEGTHKV